MGVDIPQPFNSTVSGPGGGSIPVNATVNGIPSTFHINIDTLPKISLGIDPVTINPVTINPVDIGIRLEKIPDIRAHLPANFSVGLSLLGMELACVRLCGEAQVITEPYVPGPCEHCGGGRTGQVIEGRAEPAPARRR
jgi:hypothetical protein